MKSRRIGMRLSGADGLTSEDLLVRPVRSVMLQSARPSRVRCAGRQMTEAGPEKVERRQWLAGVGVDEAGGCRVGRSIGESTEAGRGGRWKYRKGHVQKRHVGSEEGGRTWHHRQPSLDGHGLAVLSPPSSSFSSLSSRHSWRPSEPSHPPPIHNHPWHCLQARRPEDCGPPPPTWSSGPLPL